jgi:dCTP deaminase
VLNAGPKPLHLTQGQKLFLIWYADLDRETSLKKNSSEGFKGIDANLINGISGEILSLQSLSEKQRSLEKDLNQKLELQRSEVVFVRYLLVTMIGLAVGLIGWALKGTVGVP